MMFCLFKWNIQNKDKQWNTYKNREFQKLEG